MDEKLKEQLKQIIQEYNLQEIQPELETLVEDIANDKKKRTELGIFLVYNKGIEIKKALDVSTEIVRKILIPLKGEGKKTEIEADLEMPGKTVSKTEMLSVLEQEIEKVIKEVKLSFPDQIIRKRFENIILSYLKDVRDEAQVKQSLTRKSKIGGMGYSEKQADDIVDLLREEKRKIEPKAVSKEKALDFSSAQPLRSAMKKAPAQRPAPVPPPVKVPPKIEPKKEEKEAPQKQSIPLPEKEEKKEKEVPPVKPQPNPEVKPEIKPAPLPPAKPQLQVAPPAPAKKEPTPTAGKALPIVAKMKKTQEPVPSPTVKPGLEPEKKSSLPPQLEAKPVSKPPIPVLAVQPKLEVKPAPAPTPTPAPAPADLPAKSKQLPVIQKIASAPTAKEGKPVPEKAPAPASIPEQPKEKSQEATKTLPIIGKLKQTGKQIFKSKPRQEVEPVIKKEVTPPQPAEKEPEKTPLSQAPGQAGQVDLSSVMERLKKDQSKVGPKMGPQPAVQPPQAPAQIKEHKPSPVLPKKEPETEMDKTREPLPEKPIAPQSRKKEIKKPKSTGKIDNLQKSLEAAYKIMSVKKATKTAPVELPAKEEERKSRFATGALGPLAGLPVETPEEQRTEPKKQSTQQLPGQIPAQKPLGGPKISFRQSAPGLSTKTKVEEVKVTPKAYGPVDELRSIKLRDFRSWGHDQAIERIKDKIDLLGEDSLVKKQQGIRAWKESEVNRLYLEIGMEAINEGKSAEEVINSRLKSDQPTLTMEEFNLISSLNQRLRV